MAEYPLFGNPELVFTNIIPHMIISWSNKYSGIFGLHEDGTDPVHCCVEPLSFLHKPHCTL